jgi:hypothetical protein
MVLRNFIRQHDGHDLYLNYDLCLIFYRSCCNLWDNYLYPKISSAILIRGIIDYLHENNSFLELEL